MIRKHSPSKQLVVSLSIHKMHVPFVLPTAIQCTDSSVRRNTTFYNLDLPNWSSVTPAPIAEVELMPPVTVESMASA
jgi:hypothetical protein